MTNYAKLSLLCASGLMIHQASFASAPAPSASAAPAAKSPRRAAPSAAAPSDQQFNTVTQIVRAGAGNAIGAIFAKTSLAPSKERLETKATYQAGDLVRVVHGANLTSKGKVLGSFASRTGKSQPQDVLETLKQNKKHMMDVAILVPNKARPDKWLSDDLDINARATELAKHPGLLDPHRLYEVEFKKKEAHNEGNFPFSHVSCLEKIDQARYDKNDDDVFDSDYESDCDDLFDTKGVDLEGLDLDDRE